MSDYRGARRYQLQMSEVNWVETNLSSLTRLAALDLRREYVKREPSAKS